MLGRALKLTVPGALLLLASAAVPAAAISLAVLPAQPVEDAPFVLEIGLDAGCPEVTSIVTTPGLPSLVVVSLSDACPSSSQPRLVEVPLGPLSAGFWNLRAQLGGEQKLLSLLVQALPYRIELDPPHPRSGSPFILRFTGSGSCPYLGPVSRDGNLLTLPFSGACPILPPGQYPFLLEQSVSPLPPGDYVVQVADGSGDYTYEAQRFHVFGDFECIPSATVLCLQGGRFRVEATWYTDGGAVGMARPETADSGSFWFFSPDNLELLVKVLDACQSDTPRFWVFAAGLTDVGVYLTVTDTATRATHTYHRRRGLPFAPILDTAAFNCS